MAILTLQHSTLIGGKFYPAGYNINLPDKQLEALITERLEIETGEKPKSFLDKVVKKRGRPPKLQVA